MRDLGSMPSPHDAFLLNVGLESLHLRVARHCENAKKVANYLKSLSLIHISCKWRWVQLVALGGIVKKSLDSMSKLFLACATKIIGVVW